MEWKHIADFRSLSHSNFNMSISKKMKVKTMKKLIIIYMFLFIYLFLLHNSLMAQTGFSGDFTAVSTYVWRGVKINSGPALQSSAAGSYGVVTLGFWGSSINVGDDLEVETDLYAEVALPIGDLYSSLGATVYMLDFRTFNSTADAELELYATAGYGVLGLNAYYVPAQNSTKDDLNRSVYWLEFSGATQLAGADLSALIGYGTYSSRWILSGARKETVTLLLLSAGTAISEATSVFWRYSHDLGTGIENIFYMGTTYGF